MVNGRDAMAVHSCDIYLYYCYYEYSVEALHYLLAGLDSSVPLRSDSVYLHPDTMKLCGFAIAQPVSLVSPVKQV